MTALALATGLLGLAVGAAVNRTAGRFPWAERDGGSSGDVRVARATAVRRPVVELLTALLFALTALRFGVAWELPAFLFLAGVGTLLAVIDLQHLLLPNRVVVPSIGIGAALLAFASVATHAPAPLNRAVVAAAALFVVFLVLALISPRSLGMGDVKLAALQGLFLGWIGWDAVVLGVLAAFVLQAGVAIVLLAARRIGPRGELPFGPALLLGTAAAVGWGSPLVTAWLGGAGPV